MIVEYNVFNPNYNLYCSVKQILEYLPCGKIITSARFDVAQLAMYEQTQDKFYGLLDAILFGLLGYFIFMQWKYYQSGLTAVRTKMPDDTSSSELRHAALRIHFSNMWNWIDLPIIVLYLAARALDMLRYTNSKRKMDPSQLGFRDLTDVVYRYRQAYGLDAVVVLLLCVKFFKYFKLNPRLNTIIMTVTLASKALALYFVMFALAFGRCVRASHASRGEGRRRLWCIRVWREMSFVSVSRNVLPKRCIVFHLSSHTVLCLHIMVGVVVCCISFLIMAFVIFGSELYQFHTASITMRTLFLMLLGAFEYEEMAEVHPFMAPAVRFRYQYR